MQDQKSRMKLQHFFKSFGGTDEGSILFFKQVPLKGHSVFSNVEIRFAVCQWSTG